MMRGIERYMPQEFNHTSPDGGLFVWGEFEGCDINAAELLAEAADTLN